MNKKKPDIQKLNTRTATGPRLVPDGELKCIWMTAGLVAFKLCDQDFNCEFCQFNEAFMAERNFSTVGQAIKKQEKKI